jgi:hypothetical protein
VDFAPDLERFGLCPFAQITGKPCPFCGGTRAVGSLVTGRLSEAAANNLMVSLLATAASIHFVFLVAINKSFGIALGQYRSAVRQAAVLGSPAARIFWSVLFVMWVWNFFRW